MHTLLATLGDFFTAAVAFIAIISIIVFVHEFGHYIVAKLSGVKIDVFSIGFGREVVGWNDRSGTRWKISILPLGGYVKMYGDASEASTPAEAIADLPPEEKRKTFYYKPLPVKALVVVAGPLFNFVLTIVILTVFIATHGYSSTEPVIGEVIKDTPAAAAGLLPGDRVLRVNDEKIYLFGDIPRLMITNLGTPVTLAVQRGEQSLSITLTPKEITEKDTLGNDYTHTIIGIKSKELTFRNVSPPRAVWEATKSTYYFCTTTLRGIGQIITGKRSASKNIKGPIGMAKMTWQAFTKDWYTFFQYVATISANLGLINLFPIPMLDGGHLLFYAIEAVTGRPPGRRFQEYGLRIGMALIAMLMMFAILNDIRGLLLSVAK